MSKSKTIPTEIIPLDCIIDIKVKGAFVARLNQFITDYLPSVFKDLEHQNQVFSDIKNGVNQNDPYVYHTTTILALFGLLEGEAKAQKLTKIVELDPETLQEVKPEENQQPPQS
jgi:hypothetical protein